MKSQQQAILGHLKRTGSITPMIALAKYGCFRLAARIHELRCKGHNIDTNLSATGYAVYSLKRTGK